ncbi:hypothetical protein F8388_004938 [Cannabis sativa]|uniref:Pectinesterase catalytic domain-containing protein n=1 Tax=Cannabis sativa TaxID=3483 RepID=A0A7J6HRP1_CANSA|nr:hypothetical protein F8388_004938 [Cannabis sativa]
MTKLSFEMFDNYKTISEGVAAAAKLGGGGNKRVVVYMKSGVYNERVEIGKERAEIIFLAASVTVLSGRNSWAGKTLSQRRWNVAFSEDGHLDIAEALRRIQRGGVRPSIKGVV